MEWRAFRFSFSVLLPHIHRLSLQPHSDQTLYLSCYFSRSGIFHQHGNVFIIVPDIGLDRLPENRPVKLCLIFQAVTDHTFLIINQKRQSILLNRCGTKFQSFRLCIVGNYFRIIHLKPRLGRIFIHRQMPSIRLFPDITIRIECTLHTQTRIRKQPCDQFFLGKAVDPVGIITVFYPHQCPGFHKFQNLAVIHIKCRKFFLFYDAAFSLMKARSFSNVSSDDLLFFVFVDIFRSIKINVVFHFVFYLFLWNSSRK